MTTAALDLWPADFGMLPITPPVTILRQQAGLLTARTRGLLEAFVLHGKRNSDFHYQFYLRAPALDNYSYLLLSLVHPVALYPLTLTVETTEQTYQVENEEQFIQHLKDALAAPETLRVLQSLMAQSQEMTT